MCQQDPEHCCRSRCPCLAVDSKNTYATGRCASLKSPNRNTTGLRPEGWKPLYCGQLEIEVKPADGQVIRSTKVCLGHMKEARVQDEARAKKEEERRAKAQARGKQTYHGRPPLTGSINELALQEANFTSTPKEKRKVPLFRHEHKLAVRAAAAQNTPGIPGTMVHRDMAAPTPKYAQLLALKPNAQPTPQPKHQPRPQPVQRQQQQPLPQPVPQPANQTNHQATQHTPNHLIKPSSPQPARQASPVPKPGVNNSAQEVKNVRHSLKYVLN